MDADVFGGERDLSREELPCVDSAVDTELAMQFHLMLALDGYMAQDPERAKAAFRAVLSMDPMFRLSSSMAPRGNLLRALFDEARREPGVVSEQDLAQPPEGDFFVDGVPARSRPSDRPIILQWIDGQGSVRWSGFLPAGAHLPVTVLALMHEEDPMDVYSVPSVGQSPTTTEPVITVEPVDSRGPGVPLLATSGGLALASGGLLVAALVTRGTWQSEVEECAVWGGCEANPEAATRRHDELAQRARLLGYGAQAGAGLSLGLGVVGVVTLSW